MLRYNFYRTLDNLPSEPCISTRLLRFLLKAQVRSYPAKAHTLRHLRCRWEKGARAKPGKAASTVGLPHKPVAVGQLYRDFCTHFTLDERDRTYTTQLEEMGYEVSWLRTDALTLERQMTLASELLQLT
jgi:hypothetical protein